MNEKEKQERDELASEICKNICIQNNCVNGCSCTDKPCNHAFYVAEELLKLDYRKQIWHKIADGDLPQRENKDIVAIPVIVHYIDYCGYEITEAMFYFFTEKKFHLLDSRENIKNIIAWTELPEYEE